MARGQFPTLKTFWASVTDGSAVFRMRAIEHEGNFWLVPGWIESEVEEYIAPERMISLKGLL